MTFANGNALNDEEKQVLYIVPQALSKLQLCPVTSEFQLSPLFKPFPD